MENLGGALFLFFFMLLLDIMVYVVSLVCAKRQDKVSEVLKDVRVKLFFNSLLRFGISGYLRVTNCVVYLLDFCQTGTTRVQLVSSFYLFLALLMFSFPLFALIWPQVHFTQLQTSPAQFRRHSGSLLKGIKTQSRWPMTHSFVFCTRRLTMILLCKWLSSHSEMQILAFLCL